MINFPVAIKDEFDGLHFEVMDIYLSWDMFLQLFTKNDEQMELFTNTAPVVFRVMQNVLVRDVILGICRLTDKKKTMRHENLTLSRLIYLLNPCIEEDFFCEIRHSLDLIEQKSKPLRKYRNARLAHLDLKHATGRNTEVLPELPRGDIDKVLEMIKNLLNKISGHFDSVETAYDFPIYPGGVKSLVEYLKLGYETLKQNK